MSDDYRMNYKSVLDRLLTAYKDTYKGVFTSDDNYEDAKGLIDEYEKRNKKKYTRDTNHLKAVYLQMVRIIFNVQFYKI